ncbi:MAG: hypothetical protein ACRET5_09690 [Steroidobacteraceae bacterium]
MIADTEAARLGYVVRHDTGEVLRIRRGERGALLLPLTRGLTFGAFPGAGLVFAEGRLAAFLRGIASHELLPATELPAGCASVHDSFGVFGFDLPEAGVIRRLDLAGELLFRRAADGLAFLRAVASLDVPGTKRDAWITGTRVETVYLRTPRRGEVRLRIYDKGVETGDDEPGRRVRIERQLRFHGRQQPPADSLQGADLARLYHGRLAVWANATRDVVVTDLMGAQRTVVERIAEGSITPRVAERVLGTLAILDHFGPSWWEKPHTAQRRLRELRELGVVLDLDRDPGEPLPVGRLITALRDSFVA